MVQSWYVALFRELCFIVVACVTQEGGGVWGSRHDTPQINPACIVVAVLVIILRCDDGTLLHYFLHACVFGSPCCRAGFHPAFCHHDVLSFPLSIFSHCFSFVSPLPLLLPLLPVISKGQTSMSTAINVRGKTRNEKTNNTSFHFIPTSPAN